MDGKRARMATDNDQRFEALYRADAQDVHAYCLRRTSTQEAFDAASEVFGVTWRRFEEVPQGDETLPWLYGVARNVLANRARADRRRRRLWAKMAAQHEASQPGPEPQIIRLEEHEELIRALSKLPAKDQEILRLVEWEGLSREQVAAMFFVSREPSISESAGRTGRSLGPSAFHPKVTHDPRAS